MKIPLSFYFTHKFVTTSFYFTFGILNEFNDVELQIFKEKCNT